MTELASNHARRTCPTWLLVVTLLGIPGAVGCDGMSSREASETTPTVDNVKENTNAFLGQRVTLIGEVDEVYSKRAFELEELRAIFDDEVLVVTRSPIQLTGTTLKDDMNVFVTGTVNKLVTADVERELNWDLDTELEVEWQGRPVIVADNIEAVETFAHWSEKDHPAGEIVSMWAIYEAPTFALQEGTALDLEDVQVARRGKHTLWVGLHGRADLFVVPAADAMPAGLEQGARVDVKGTLKGMPEAKGIPQAWHLTDADLLRLRQGGLYLHATTIQPREASAQVNGTPGAGTPEDEAAEG